MAEKTLRAEVEGGYAQMSAALREASAERAEQYAAENPRDESEPGGVVLDSGEISATDDPDERPLERLLGKAWAMLPDALVELGMRMIRAEHVPGNLMRPQAARRPASARQRSADGTEVAVIPLRGTITPRGSFFSLLFGGGGGLQAFRDQFRQAMADGNVSAVVLDIDSPGGLIDLVQETADEVRGARGGKPIVAIANTCCASAAYWIGSQADEFVITPSGQAGSIGVFMVHEDISRLEAAMGIKTTIISAGEHKTDGNPYEPLSKSAKQAFQNEVDDLYAMFTDAVAAGRGVTAQAVRAGYGRGRSVLAEEAVRIGLADRVETFEQVMSRLGGMTKDPPANPGEMLDDEEGIEASETEAPVQGADDGAEPHMHGESAPTLDYLNGKAERAAGLVPVTTYWSGRIRDGEALEG